MTPQLLTRPPEREREEREQTQKEPQRTGQTPPELEAPPIEIEDGRELSLPPTTSPAEAAAIAAALSAHLSVQDASVAQTAEPDSVSNWTHARRLGAGRTVRHLPRGETGDTWKLSSRLS